MTERFYSTERHDLRNQLHSILLVAGMVGLCSIMGWFLWGWLGVLWLSGFALILMLLAPKVSPKLILKMYNASPLDRGSARSLVMTLEDLSRKAKLDRTPKLYYIPSRIPNAFTVGESGNAVIAVTHGLLRTFSAREIRGVLAHEISHVVNDDGWIMSMADVVSQMVNAMSWVGQILLLINLPLIIIGQAHVPWILVLILIFAPTLSSLLQLALSRTREYDADLEAVKLTRDPRGLASALAKLEKISGALFEKILMPGQKIPEPSILRTHPKTQDRIDRLMEIEKEFGFQDSYPHEPEPIREIKTPDIRVVRPRRRIGGLWY